MIREQHLTGLPGSEAPAAARPHSNPARDVQEFVSAPMAVAGAAVDKLNLAAASVTDGLSKLLPSFPAARLFCDLVFGWPHYHLHPPNLIPPAPPIFLPSIGPVICAGAVNVLINGFPSARCGDVGFGAWCGGFYPLFEVFTGSSNVFIGGARASRQLIDFTRHCLPPFLTGRQGVKQARKGLQGFDKAMMGFTGAMGVLGVGASLTDMANANQDADAAETAAEAAAASADASASALGAAMTAAQTLMDLAAMALSVGMGKDPGLPPMLCLGNFITGSPNVLIGGIPMPGWMAILRGLGKLLKKSRLRFGRPRPRDGAGADGCTRRGCPVDVATGKLFTEAEDFAADGPILFQFMRYYSHINDDDGPLGRGWTHSLNLSLVEEPETQALHFTDQEGRLVAFNRPGVGASEFNPLEQILLARTDQDRYVITTSDGLNHVFAGSDGAGSNGPGELRLEAIEDLHGNQIGLSYHDGLMTQVTDSVGRRFRFDYTDEARLSAVWLLARRPGETDQRLAAYEYNDQGDLVAVYDALNQPVRYRYQNHLLIQETNRNGFSFYYQYDLLGGEPWVTHTWGDGGLFDIWFEYDLGARKTVARDSRGAATYYWNDLGLVEVEIDPYGGTWRTMYDEFGNATLELDPLGQARRWQYDPEGNLASESDPLGRRTAYRCNRLGFITEVVHPTGASEKYEYDARGNMIRKQTATGAVWRYEYDGRGLLVATDSPDGLRVTQGTSDDWRRSWVRDDLGLIAEFELDALGEVIVESDARGEFVRYQRDAAGRVVRHEYRDGCHAEMSYDAHGNVSSIRNTGGHSTFFTYNGRERITSSTDARGNQTRFEFDAAEVLTRVVRPDGKAYALGMGPAELLRESETFDGRRLTFDHDPAQRTTSVEDARRQRTQFEFDAAGNVTRIIFADGSTTDISYNLADQITEAANQHGSFTRSYDLADQVTREEMNGLAVESTYDELGRRIERRTAGRALSFKYDARGRLIEVATGSEVLQQIEYDELNRPVRRKFGAMTEHRRYDALNRMWRQQVINQSGRVLVEREYGWDPGGLLVEVKDSSRGQAGYKHDANGCVTVASYSRGEAQLYAYDDVGNITLDWRGPRQYDDRDRLAAAGNRRFLYNGKGQVEAAIEGARRTMFSYDCAGRLVRVEHTDGKVTEYGYDALGRRLFKRHDGVETKYLWDVNNLILEKSGDQTVEYLYVEDEFEPLGCWRDGVFYAYINDHLNTPQELISGDGRVVWAGQYGLWGEVRPVVHEVENTLRFMGQFYDPETGLHYNRHRYYDPGVGRYISPDPFGLEGGINLYSYVANPLLAVDPYGLAVSSYHDKWNGDKRTSPVTIETETVTTANGQTFERPIRASGMVEPVSTKGRGDPPNPLSGYRTRGTTYDKGHLFALEHGGPEVSANIAPQGAYFQRHGRWRKMENWVNQQATAGRTVHLDVRVNYRGDSRIPHSFDVRVRVDGVLYSNPPPLTTRRRRPIRNQCQ